MPTYLIGDLPDCVKAPKELGLFRGAKVRCENSYWCHHLQLALFESLGCRWPMVSEVPWNTRRPLLVIEQSRVGTHQWFFAWATEPDFEACPLPEYSAKALVQAYRNLPAERVGFRFKR